MVKNFYIFFFAVIAFTLGLNNPVMADDSDISSEFRAGEVKRTTAETYKPVRVKPRKTGEFKVDLVVIAFPDCEMPDPETVRKSLSQLNGGYTIQDYYKMYSYGITWPVLDVYPVVYVAPHPLGYYCRTDARGNFIGYVDDGPARAHKLREDALKYVRSKSRLSKQGDYICYVYARNLVKDKAVLERVVRPYYPQKPTDAQLKRGVVDTLAWYSPQIQWADPLWPNSIPQVTYPSGGGTLVHEIGHVLGAPDFYHASEERDGVPGAPSLPWSYGPTGMAYCRYIYNAFVPADAYQKVTEPGDYTLSPRSVVYEGKTSDGGKQPPLGIFIPSSHPNYLFCLEYCRGEKPPVGNPNSNGLLIHVINVTMRSPMMGPPDLCYTYRPDDPDHKALRGGDAYFKPGSEFTATSNPAAVLPNLLPAGIEIKNIRFNEDGTCTFTLSKPQLKISTADMAASLLPQTEMVEVGSATPTSFKAVLNIRYRGEPLLTEYGFCYSKKPNPNLKNAGFYPLYHRDRYDARIKDLEPGETYYVRAYAKSPRGTRYSENELQITMPKDLSESKGVTLFHDTDRIFGNFYFTRWHWGVKGEFRVSANSYLAFMSLANYYRTLPCTPPARRMGHRPTQKIPEGSYDMTRIHSNPGQGRPKFRMVETDRLYADMRHLMNVAGFTHGDFIPASVLEKKKKNAPKNVRRAGRKNPNDPSYGDIGDWVKKCATALKIQNPAEVFVSCQTADQILELADRVKESIANSEPVLVVRQNLTKSAEHSVRWPLDIAIIDGIGMADDEFHVVFPLGRDRDFGERKSGFMKLTDLLIRTSDAMMMFYRPGGSPNMKNRR